MAETIQAQDMAELRIRNMPEEMHRKLKHWAVDEECSVNDLILRIIADAVAKQGKK